MPLWVATLPRLAGAKPLTLWFSIVWWVGVVYIVLAYTLGFRLNSLREANRAPSDTPNVFNLLDQLRLIAFMFNSKHRSLDDPFTSFLVITCRCLFVVALVGMVTLPFAQHA
jgi:hypothetical protein